MKAPLSSKRKNVSVILGSKQIPLPPREKQWYYTRLLQWCADNCDSYAFNMHDRDKNEDGSQKWLHLHMALIMKKNDRRLRTILNELAKVCEISPLSIQIDEMTSENGSVQYLIHKKDLDKTQYDKSDIVCSYTEDELETILNADEDTMSITYLLSVCKECKLNRIEIMQKIGLNYYHRYRLVIGDIINTYLGRV